MDLSRALQQTALTLRTVRFIKFSQLAYRIWFKLRYVRLPDSSPAPRTRARRGWIRSIPKATSVSADGHYTFLNVTLDFSDGIQWSNAPASRLWFYNLHYFDFINADDILDRAPANLVVMRTWVSANPPVQGTGWEPYPTSLRIVNWVKWFISVQKFACDSDDDMPDVAGKVLLDSLAVQIRWLAKTVEYHLLANHVFTNGKALVYAGLFFRGPEADRWLASGVGIVNAELQEQILDDGGHFERSPMYHHIILEDLLDLINLARATPSSIDERVLASWVSTASKMRGWAQSMIHPSGKIAFFNDAAYGIAPTLKQIDSYARRLNIPDHFPASRQEQSRLLASSGFALLRTASTQLIADVGPVGPDYQPGHAHADTLSFELAYKGETVVVNSGTSTYEMGEQRQFERSTRAHSTVEVSGNDSSEVWAGFRVARRAKPFNIQFDANERFTRLSACHDGYQRLSTPVTHQRQWFLDDQKLLITDSLTADVDSAVARFYLHPDVQILDNQYLITKAGSKIAWSVQGGIAKAVQSQWLPAFGQSQENVHIEVTLIERESIFTLHFS